MMEGSCCFAFCSEFGSSLLRLTLMFNQDPDFTLGAQSAQGGVLYQSSGRLA